MVNARKQPVVEEPCGSGQSPASAAKDKRAQPRLLAAAASRKSGGSSSVSTPIKKKRNVYQFKVAGNSDAKRVYSSSPSKKAAKATFAVVAATYQKGDKAGQYTGAVYMRSKPRYGLNEAYKAALAPHLLAEGLRWNDELKVYTAKVYTIKQAQMLLDITRDLDDKHKEDLDESVDESPFEHARDAEIHVFPMTVTDGPTGQNEDVVAIAGMTYPFKNELMKRGFIFKNTVNGTAGVQLWLKAMDADDPETEELVCFMEKYGFTVEQHDAVEFDDDDAKEE